MKLLYIGHYKEHSGWAKAAINNIKCINTTDINIVCRNLQLTEQDTQFKDEEILSLENKDTDNVDYCIQNVLPHHITGTDKFKKNIAYFMHELDSIKDHNWYHNLKLVDEIWVPNSSLKINLIKDGFDDSSIKVIPMPSDLSNYKDLGHRIKFGHKNHTFKVYFICDMDDRKNLESIIRCFHSEFHKSEPVSLVLKIKKNGVSPKALKEAVAHMCDEIKKHMRLYDNLEDYNHELIITDDFTEEQMNILHLSCDCYLGPTHGEGWGIPAFDAMCYGKTPICSNEGGPKDYIDPNNKNTGWLVNGQMGICSHRNAAFKDLFTAKHHWFIPSELEIKKAMRYYYENRVKNNKDGLEQARKFSYYNVGNIIKGALYE